MKLELEQRLLDSIRSGASARAVIRDMIERGDIESPKQAWATLEKWETRDWYEYGVTLDLGWLTDKAPLVIERPAERRQ